MQLTGDSRPYVTQQTGYKLEKIASGSISTTP